MEAGLQKTPQNNLQFELERCRATAEKLGILGLRA
jgi:hypothetical protein